MTAISFKTDEQFKLTLTCLAKQTGINLSAYIKMLLTKSVKEELSRVTENGLTVAEELEIVANDEFSETVGPFQNMDDLFTSLGV